MQKWGKNRNGTNRFRCKYCEQSATWKRRDLTQKYKKELFKNWLLGKLSVSEISTKYGISRQSLHNWFVPFWDEEPTPKAVDFRDQVLIIDGKYIARDATVLVACTLSGVVSWSFTQSENATNWTLFLSQLPQIPFAFVSDGQRGILKALKTLFPGLIIQRCQFHVIKQCLSKLTQNPESVAAQELRTLVLQISRVKTKEHFKCWFEAYLLWRRKYHSFLKEKTYQPQNLTPSGRQKWHYTHGRLHAAHSHLKNALPNLFKYLLYPQIPNTTNFVEGAINSPMQEKLRFHRGLKLQKRRILIAHYLSSKQPKKPTQIFT